MRTRACLGKGWTILGKKPFENIMWITNIFFSPHNVSYIFKAKNMQGLSYTEIIVCKCFQFGHGDTFFVSRKCFNPFPNKPWFLRVCSTSLLKTLWENEKLLVTSVFSFSHSVFYPFGELSAIFIKFEIVVCKLFQFGRV